MKQISKIIFLALIFSTCTEAQSVTWQRLYNGPFNFDDDCRDLCYSDSDNFFAVGYSRQTGFAGLNIYVLKLKPTGDTLWTRVLGERSNQLANTCTSSGDGGCVLSGSSDSAFSIKINKEGQIIWTKYYGNSSVQIYEIIKTSDGGYIACGFRIGSIYDGYVFKIDPLGNLQWEKIFSENFVKIYYSVIESNNQYIFAGLQNDSKVSPQYGVILKLDLSGNTIWEKKYITTNGSTIFRKINLNNNGYLIGGNTYDSTHVRSQIFLTKIDTSGKTNYTKLIKYKANEYLNDLMIMDSKYIFAADTDTVTGRNARIYITDTLGNIQHQKIFYLSDYTLLKSILPASNGDIFFGGTSQTYSKTDRDAYAVRADSTLFSKPLKINSNNISINNNFKLYQNYPNPFNPGTNIRFEISKKSYVILKVFDISGREIKTLIQKNLTDGTYEILFEAKELPSGIYFCKLESNKFVQTKRMVLIK